MADFEALVEEGVGFLLKEELFEVFEVVVVVDNAVEHEVVVVEIEVVASVADEAVVEVMGQLDCWVSLYTFPSEKGKYLFENKYPHMDLEANFHISHTYCTCLFPSTSLYVLKVSMLSCLFI